MTWIKTVKRNEGDDAQRAKLREAFRWGQMYPPEYRASVPALVAIEKETGEGGISDAHTLLPDTLYHAFALLGTLLQPDLALSRTQQEMIATTVSVINHCFY